MDNEYILHLNNFKQHLQQLEICDKKVKDKQSKVNLLLNSYSEKTNKASEEINCLINNFKQNVEKITLDEIDEISIKITTLREKHDFFGASINVLNSDSSEVKKEITTELNKLNLLAEAASKLKVFIDDRFLKVKAKFPRENHSELDAVYNKSVKISTVVNEIVGRLSAKVSFAIASEMEASTKLQTMESVVAGLKKKLSI